ncbi:MAG TPA: GTPase Era [Longimicrobiales bacterium]
MRRPIEAAYIRRMNAESREGVSGGEGAGSGAAVETRAGYVALVGRPNAGKSTLLNALTGERLSIVTPRAQTTRERVMGIYTTPEAQVVFVDTPGLLEPRYLLQRSMLEAALAALGDADLVLLLLDATRPAEARPTGEPLDALHRRRNDLFVAVNKTDAAPASAAEELAGWAAREFGREAFAISAAKGWGIDELRAALIAALPVSPFLYPEDDIAVQPLRFFVAEWIRETIFEEYREEIPYSTAVRIEEFREGAIPVYIRAIVFVERESQKAILVGKGGAGIKRLGQRSREKIEAFLGERVFLDLRVKAIPGWRRKRSALKHLGYPLPQERREGGRRAR